VQTFTKFRCNKIKLMKEPKFKMFFEGCVLKPLVSSEKDKYLALASLHQLKSFLPEVDASKNYDLLPVAFNAAVVNRVNKNDDAICTAIALEIYKTFINKPINIEHDRKKVIGTILTAGFSEFGTDNPLSEEQVKNLKGPFNITLGGIIWRVVDSDIAGAIEDSADPYSNTYASISASWELGMEGYDVLEIHGESKNTEDGKICTDPMEFEAYEKMLRSNGGKGVLGEKHYYRVASQGVLAMGIGLTENPAAEVKGVLTASEVELPKLELNLEEINKSIKSSCDSIEAVIEEVLSEKSKKNEESISQVASVNVNDDSKIMKITKIEDITDESVKQLKASAVADFIVEQVKLASDKFESEKAEKENALKAATELHNSTLSKLDEATKALAELNEKIAALETAKAEQEKAETFNQRMASFDEVYELSAEDRKAIATTIKEMSAEQFTDYEKNMSVLLKEKNKEYIKSKAAVVTTTVASTTATTETPAAVVEQAVTNAQPQTEVVPATTSPATPSVKEKYASAFSIDKGFKIEYSYKRKN
jgi:hypothetical protein